MIFFGQRQGQARGDERAFIVAQFGMRGRIGTPGELRRTRLNAGLVFGVYRDQARTVGEDTLQVLFAAPGWAAAVVEPW